VMDDAAFSRRWCREVRLWIEKHSQMPGSLRSAGRGLRRPWPAEARDMPSCGAAEAMKGGHDLRYVPIKPEGQTPILRVGKVATSSASFIGSQLTWSSQ